MCEQVDDQDHDEPQGGQGGAEPPAALLSGHRAPPDRTPRHPRVSMPCPCEPAAAGQGLGLRTMASRAKPSPESSRRVPPVRLRSASATREAPRRRGRHGGPRTGRTAAPRRRGARRGARLGGAVGVEEQALPGIQRDVDACDVDLGQQSHDGARHWARRSPRARARSAAAPGGRRRRRTGRSVWPPRWPPAARLRPGRSPAPRW